MSVPTAAVPEQEWNSKREALLVKEKELTHARDALAAGSWVRRHDQYSPDELAGGRI